MDTWEAKIPIKFRNGHTILMSKKASTRILISSDKYITAINTLMNRTNWSVEPIFL